jgi:hypothetical protein
MAARQAIEDAAASVFEERLLDDNDVMTKQEVLENHDLSNDAQRTIISALDKKKKLLDEVAEVASAMASGDGSLNTKDHGNAVDALYDKASGGQGLASDEGAAASVQLTKGAGFMPRDAFNELRGMTQSTDPAVLGRGMEIANQALLASDNAFANYDGRAGIVKTLDDYKFYAQFGSSEEAAQKVIDARVKPPKNVTDEAKKLSNDLDISDVVNHFDQAWFSDPTIGDKDAQEVVALMPEAQSNEMMYEYRRLFNDAFLEVGNEDVAKNRALQQMGRIYGVNGVSGDGRIMKFPPNMFYKSFDGSQDWMKEQLASEVSALAFGDEALDPGTDAVTAFVDGASLGEASKWVRSSQIKLVSDAQTREEAITGQKPGYIVYYMKDGLLEQAPNRFYFDEDAAQKAYWQKIDARQADVVNGDARDNYYRNVELYGQERADEMIREQEGQSSAIPR